MAVEDHQRQGTPEERAAIMERMGADWERVERVLDKAQLVHRSRDAGHRRYIRLVQIAEEFQEVIAPHVACRGRGCSHCCKMAVNITEREAIRIGEYLGRAPVRLPVVDDPHAIMAQLEQDVERYTAQACPMLAADGSCTVYPVRPLACRLAHSLAADPEPCNLETGRHWVPKLTTMQISGVAVTMDITRSIGDIRLYFPWPRL